MYLVKSMKNIQLRNIEDVVYFTAVEWKGKLHCDTWEDLFIKIFENKELLEKIVDNEKQEKTDANRTWSKSIDSKLDQRDKEILKNKEDILV